MTDLNKVNFMSKARFNSLASTNDDELYIVETDIAVDSDVVHKTGVESIAGAKTFNDNISIAGTTTLSNSLIVGGYTTINNSETISGTLNLTNSTGNNIIINLKNIDTTSGVNSFKDIAGFGTDNVRTGGLRLYHSEDDIHKTILYTTDDTNTYATDLQVCYDNTNSIGYITTNAQPAASNSFNENIIPTIGWVNDPTKSTNVVHRSNDESIAGTKTFSTAPIIDTTTPESRITTKFEDLLIGSTTSNNYFAGFRSVDSEGTEFANCNCSYKSTGVIGCNFYVTRVVDDVTKSGTLGVYVDSEGTVYTSAPTPPIGDNSTQIATTAYVNGKIQFVNSLPANPVSGVLYLIPES